MADTYRTAPSQYATVYTSTTATGGVAFGFNASSVKLTNDGAATAWVTFNSTVATTDDFQLSSGESIHLSQLGVGVYGVGIKSSAASTAGPSVRVGAWG